MPYFVQNEVHHFVATLRNPHPAPLTFDLRFYVGQTFLDKTGQTLAANQDAAFVFPDIKFGVVATFAPVKLELIVGGVVTGGWTFEDVVVGSPTLELVSITWV